MKGAAGYYSPCDALICDCCAVKSGCIPPPSSPLVIGLIRLTCNCEMCKEATCEDCDCPKPDFMYFSGVEVHYICKECAITKGWLW